MVESVSRAELELVDGARLEVEGDRITAPVVSAVSAWNEIMREVARENEESQR